MIEIQITHSPDTDVIGTHRFFQKHFSLGGNSASLLVDDEEFNQTLLTFQIQGVDALMVSSQNANCPLLINEKTIQGPTTLKLNDKVRIGHTEFLVKNIKHTQEENKDKKKIIQNNLSAIRVNESLEQLLGILETELKNITDH